MKKIKLLIITVAVVICSTNLKSANCPENNPPIEPAVCPSGSDLLIVLRRDYGINTVNEMVNKLDARGVDTIEVNSRTWVVNDFSATGCGENQDQEMTLIENETKYDLCDYTVFVGDDISGSLVIEKDPSALPDETGHFQY